MNSKTNSCTTHRIEGISSSNGTNLRCQNRFHKASPDNVHTIPLKYSQSRTAHARQQDDAQDPRATHNRRANDGAREQCTGLRHRPEKGCEGATPGRRASRVARKKIAKTFPSFDERIGWSIHGAYDDEGLPVEVEERLSAFFRPHDDAFFEILGRRLAWRT